ncbi:MAG: hypothetical protein KY457_15225 [Actinobacteria bacterium]|nr:hypothetical protein [Actinomycetota bacterium]
MQLQARAPVPPPADDLARALQGAAEVLGHRPAVTVLRTDRRDEQGVASLRQWAAKTAHWLAIEHGLGPGDRLGLVGPPGWVPVGVCLGAWWAGLRVVLGDGAGVDVAVVHEHAATPMGAEVVTYGAAVDGSPVGPVADEPYAIAVQAFPDQPPAPGAAPELVAAEAEGRSWTHAELLAAARALPDGRLGLDGPGVPASLWLPALAVHPLTSGRPTVLLDGVGRDAAGGERVESWLSVDPTSPPPDPTGPSA